MPNVVENKISTVAGIKSLGYRYGAFINDQCIGLLFIITEVTPWVV